MSSFNRLIISGLKPTADVTTLLWLSLLLDHLSKGWKNSRADEYRSYICEKADGCEPVNPCPAGTVCESNSHGDYRCVDRANSSDVTAHDPCAAKPCENGERMMTSRLSDYTYLTIYLVLSEA